MTARWRDTLMRWLFPPYPEPPEHPTPPEDSDQVQFQQALREHDREMRLIEDLVSTYRQQPTSKPASES